MDTKRGNEGVVVVLGGGGGMNGRWDRHIYTTMHMKQITNEKLPYCTGNSTQCSVVT